MSHTVPYYINATLTGEAVGLTPIPKSLNKMQATAPVVVNAKVRDWNASQNINQNGPVRLGVNVLQFTFQSNGEVMASNDPSQSTDWYIFPEDAKNGLFYIAANPEHSKVWTATHTGEPIRIEDIKFPASRSQIFQFSNRA